MSVASTPRGDGHVWQSELEKAWRSQAQMSGRMPPQQLQQRPFLPKGGLTTHPVNHALPSWDPMGSSQHLLHEVRARLRREYLIRLRPHDRGVNPVKRHIEGKLRVVIAAKRWYGLFRRYICRQALRVAAFDVLGEDAGIEALLRHETVTRDGGGFSD